MIKIMCRFFFLNGWKNEYHQIEFQFFQNNAQTMLNCYCYTYIRYKWTIKYNGNVLLLLLLLWKKWTFLIKTVDNYYCWFCEWNDDLNRSNLFRTCRIATSVWHRSYTGTPRCSRNIFFLFLSKSLDSPLRRTSRKPVSRMFYTCACVRSYTHTRARAHVLMFKVYTYVIASSHERRKKIRNDKIARREITIPSV